MKKIRICIIVQLIVIINSYSQMENDSLVPLSIDLDKIDSYIDSTFNASVKSIILGQKSPFIVSVKEDYSLDETVKEKVEEVQKKLEQIGKFNNLKELYLFNFHLAKIPKSILEIKSLEFLQVNYFGHTNFEEECAKIKNLPNLKVVVLHFEILKKEQIKKIRDLLPNIKVINIDRL